MDDHRAILAALGDYKIIAERLGVSPTNVSRWKSDGIPPIHWISIVRMARAKHVRISVDLIERTAPPHRQRARRRIAEPAG